MATVRILRSTTAAAVPSSLVSGQIAINESDGKLFFRNGAGAVTQLATGATELYSYATTSLFPGSGATTALYLAIDSGKIFQWTGSVYAEVGPVGGNTDTLLRSLLVPAAPTSVTATGGNAQATVSWTAPSVLAQTPITDYTVQYSTNSGTTWTTFTDAVSATASATVTGLTNGTAYVFRVAAVNGVGTGSYSSASSAVMPAADAIPVTFANKYSQAGVAASAHSVTGSTTITASLTGGDDYTDTRLWLLIARTGTLSYTVTASSEGSDGGRLYLTSSSPSQHAAVSQYNPATISGLTNVSAAAAGTATSTGSVAVTAGQYLVLRYYKDSSDAALNDRITATLSIA